MRALLVQALSILYFCLAGQSHCYMSHEYSLVPNPEDSFVNRAVPYITMCQPIPLPHSLHSFESHHVKVPRRSDRVNTMPRPQPRLMKPD